MQKKLMLSYIVVIFAAVGISMFATWTKGYSYIDKQTIDNQLIQAELIADSFNEAVTQIDYVEFAKEYSDRYGFRVTIIGSNGTVYADSDAQGILENHATREEVVRALKG
ncbi:MAG TPA: hypothetical protein VHQ24_13580, partial [Lachnospiraceae bacterium]|nr:hypothetical protein [Lachnospiraceae bacterium]